MYSAALRSAAPLPLPLPLELELELELELSARSASLPALSTTLGASSQLEVSPAGAGGRCMAALGGELLPAMAGCGEKC